MSSIDNISCTVDSWIDEEELPVRANLKVIRRSDPNYGLTEEQIRDRNEFIRYYLLRGFESLLMIPKQTSESDFFMAELADLEDSAFNTVDFQRQLKPFNNYAYAMKKIMERVKDLAILHSSITSAEGRLNTYRRYEAFVNSTFRNQLIALAKRFQNAPQEVRFELKGRIGRLNLRIVDCKKIWEQYAPPGNWDH